MNTQPIESVVSSRKDGKLEVVKIWRTIQGEGPFVGRPAVFVRLAGCNLQCPKCDTDYTSQRDELAPMDILSRASILFPFGQSHQKFIVLTGGEPFRQDLIPFLHHALDYNWQVQIETNGAFVPKRFTESFLRRENPPMELQRIFDLRDPPDISIVCSPKTVIHPDIVPLVDAWKYVVRAGDIDADGLPIHALDNKVPVARPPKIEPLITYIQPCDEGDEVLNRANMAAALDSCMRFGYRMCLQTHKIVGLE
jgi:7-carboxy-7-deazaguanine synthase